MNEEMEKVLLEAFLETLCKLARDSRDAEGGAYFVCHILKALQILYPNSKKATFLFPDDFPQLLKEFAAGLPVQ